MEKCLTCKHYRAPFGIAYCTKRVKELLEKVTDCGTYERKDKGERGGKG